ncbi:hypothetical protein OG453_06620 [Streptomyces sp. NBC_01381]|uniref:hypothetical protein n=1 Tax=Streptomyces sp. NBC_01381 TaxID=2903845 RepID=UPI00224FE4F2|nr:hypothetical protein [Streptomyces sp. NBC_01381]MCX4666341.1 hypothetical protein [Streptomyces sp. NBC_01381]
MVRMVTSPQRPRPGAVSALLIGTALAALTGCGEQRRDADTDAGAPSTSASASSSPGASPYVEPGVVDGAPHNGDNNAYRRPGDMTPADEEAAQAEAARMEPVLKQLHREKKWDPESVKDALTGKLGYEIRKVSSRGKLLGGELDVQAMRQRYEGETDEYVTPEGASIGLYVGRHACVTAFVQPTNYGLKTNGPFPETGCMEPPVGH